MTQQQKATVNEIIDAIASEAVWQADKWMDSSPEAINSWEDLSPSDKRNVVDDTLDAFVERYYDLFEEQIVQALGNYGINVFETHRADIVNAIVEKMN